jgi:hypothetical protein
MDDQQKNLQIDENMQNDADEKDSESDAGNPGSRVNPQ